MERIPYVPGAEVVKSLIRKVGEMGRKIQEAVRVPTVNDPQTLEGMGIPAKEWFDEYPPTKK